MIVSLGILAHNEESRIESTLRSLFQQSVFLERADLWPGSSWEVCVVPNGCSDRTEQLAEAALKASIASIRRPVKGTLCPLLEAGKSNAWNEFVHRIARQDADLLVMVDADIEFGHTDTIANSIKHIIENPAADVVVDLPLKDFAKKDRQSFLERLSLRISAESLNQTPGIAGSFYCARGEVLRSIWMPKNLSGEDGFLRAMVVTNLFRSDVEDRKVARAADASHYYEGTTKLGAMFKHELRLVIGTTLNCYLAWDFLRFATDPHGPGAGVLIRNWLQKDPDWYRKYIENEVRNRGFWVLPRGLLFRRFARLRGLPIRLQLRKLPLALVAFLFDIPVFVAANRRLRSGRALGFW